MYCYRQSSDARITLTDKYDESYTNKALQKIHRRRTVYMLIYIKCNANDTSYNDIDNNLADDDELLADFDEDEQDDNESTSTATTILPTTATTATTATSTTTTSTSALTKSTIQTTTATTRTTTIPFYKWSDCSCAMDALYVLLIKSTIIMKHRQQQQQQIDALRYIDPGQPVAVFARDALSFAEKWIETIQTSIINNELTTKDGIANVLTTTTTMKMEAYKTMITKVCERNKAMYKFGDFQNVDELWEVLSPSWLLLFASSLDVVPLLLPKKEFLQVFEKTEVRIELQQSIKKF